MQGVTSKPQPAYARAAATLRKVRSTRADSRANTDKDKGRMDSRFSNGASLAHKLTNYANKIHNPGLASDGSLSNVQGMEEQ